MTGITLPAAAALAWLLTPFVSGGLLARSGRARDAIGRHLPLCLTAGWLGLAALVWGATALDTGRRAERLPPRRPAGRAQHLVAQPRRRRSAGGARPAAVGLGPLRARPARLRDDPAGRPALTLIG